MKGRTGFFVVGVLAGLVGAVTYLKLKKQGLANNAEKLSESVSDSLKELESRLEGGLRLDLVERTA